MSEARTYTAPAMALRTALILFIFVVLFTALLAGAYQWTKPAIEASAAAEKMKFINEVLPAGSYDNDLLNDTLELPPTPELGLTTSSKVYRARLAGQPAALVLEAVAPDGYAGEIRLVLGITAAGDVTGVRVVQHKETPGLGDYIDPKKDKNKAEPWIDQFAGLNYPQVAEREWKVKKDGGRITYRTGATVTPRAVSDAVFRAARYAMTHRNELFAQEAQ
ncbi:MAG: electron transport complex subunit RsxG [Azovibrio sp.]|uniref:electron transport complex subunit RsxG n=1 Tax=Azovibrio sp. TaxID=1872673 RepID=UPI003C73DBF3